MSFAAFLHPGDEFTIRMRWVDGQLVGELEINAISVPRRVEDEMYTAELVMHPFFGDEKLTVSFGRPGSQPPPTSAAPAAAREPGAEGSQR